MRAVANAGPLIHLSWIDQLDLLHLLLNEVMIPSGVRDEVLRPEPEVPGMAAIRDALAAGWITVRAVEDPAAVAVLTEELDRGESEAIVLMQEVGADLLLLDDRRARMNAQRRGLRITGTIGILRMGRERGLLTAVLPTLQQLRLRGFRISAELMAEIQREETENRNP